MIVDSNNQAYFLLNNDRAQNDNDADIWAYVSFPTATMPTQIAQMDDPNENGCMPENVVFDDQGQSLRNDWTLGNCPSWAPNCATPRTCMT